ncbi:PA14 domain-containing protein [Salinimicrobium sp. 3283s]|uniref:PA14 domain-containing protein n=1 Tax=Salinimicrobium sp. 3283s TaxID=3114359 RepID=UPI0031EAFE5D
MNLPPSLMRYLSLCIFMLGSYFVQGQSISKPIVSGSPVCSNQLEVTFDATKAIIFGNFDSNTNYYIELQKSGTIVYSTLFKSDKTTSLFGEWTISLSTKITPPAAFPPGSGYTIGVRSTNPDVPSVTSDPFTIYAGPISPAIGSISQPTCTTSTGSVILNSLPATGSWTIAESPGGLTKTGTGTSTTFPGLSAGTHTFTVTNANGCISSASANVVINPPPTVPAAPIIGQIIQPTCTTATGSVAISGLPSGNWTINPGGFTGSGTNKIITGLQSGNYNYTVTNETGCTSPASENVTIDTPPNPPAPIVSSRKQPTCTIATGSVTLSGLPSGNWTINPGGITGSGTTKTITGLTPGNYTYTVDVPNTTTGLKAEYFNNRYLSGAPSITRKDATINFNWGSGNPGSPINNDNFSVKWTGQIQPRYTENYTFTTQSDDGIRLWINGSLIIDNWTDHAAVYNNGTISLTAGFKYDIKLEYYENTGEAVVQLYWSSANQANQIVPQSQLFSIDGICTSFSSEPVVIDPQPATPSAPVVGFVEQPTCTSATGSVSLSGLPSGSWTINPGAISGSGTNKKITGLLPGNYKYTVTNSSGCVSSATANVVINPQPLSISNNSINYSGETRNICSASIASQIKGSQPTGGSGTYSYIWESSTTGPESGFDPATGTNNTIDYNPGELSQTTWFRRSVSSAMCEPSLSNVVEIIVNPLPALTATSTDTTICIGETINITGSLSGTGPWTVRGTMNGAVFSIPTSSSSLSYAFSPTVTTTINITAVEDANGCVNNENHTVTITVLQENLWTGAEDTNWNNPANWNCSTVPTLETDVRIPSGLGNYPIILDGDSGLSRNLIIESGASVDIQQNLFGIAGQAVNQGVFNAEFGSVIFASEVSQTIPQGFFDKDLIENLYLSNAIDVTSEASINIKGLLHVIRGKFYTGNKLTLLSNSTRTAFIEGGGNGQVLDTVHMQRYLSNAFGYKYFSSPFQNSTVADLAANFDLTNPETGFPHLYEYLENREDSAGNDLTGWQKYLDSTASFKPGFGYAINPLGEAGTMTLELSGIVNNGPVSVALQNNNRTYTNGFNLVGNPYPSPIDWNLMVANMEGIDNGIHFFTATAGDRYTGTYTSYVEGVSTDGRSSNIIPSMQGFFVRVSDPVDGIHPVTATLQFNNSYRVGNETEQQYYKTRNKAEIPQIRLTAGFKGEKDADATVIYFSQGGTPQFEKELDAQKLLNTAVNVPSFYSLTSKREKLSINAISRASIKTMEIPLGISAERSGEMIIELAETRNLFPSLHVYLKDMKKKVLRDLDRDPLYSFTSQKGQNNDQFILMFASEKLSPVQMELAMEDFTVYTKNEQVLVRLNLPNNAEGKVILSSMAGQVLQTKRGSGKDVLTFSGMAAGIYLVTLETEQESQTKKVIFKE